MNLEKVRVCKPVSQGHHAGAKWLNSLSQVIERSPESDPEFVAQLKHSLNFYSCYAQTGDKRYLGLCEEFMQASLAA